MTLIPNQPEWWDDMDPEEKQRLNALVNATIRSHSGKGKGQPKIKKVGKAVKRSAATAQLGAGNKPTRFKDDVNFGTVAKTKEYAVLRPMPHVFYERAECKLCHHVGSRLDAMHYGRKGVHAFESTWVMPNKNHPVHWSCAIWSDRGFQADRGRLFNVGNEITRSSRTRCAICKHLNATVTCHMCRRTRKPADLMKNHTYHYACLVENHALDWGFNVSHTTVSCPRHKLQQPTFYRKLSENVTKPDDVHKWHREESVKYREARKALVAAQNKPEPVSTGFAYDDDPNTPATEFRWPVLHPGFQDLQQTADDPLAEQPQPLDIKEREKYDQATIKTTMMIQLTRKRYPLDEPCHRDDWFAAHEQREALKHAPKRPRRRPDQIDEADLSSSSSDEDEPDEDDEKDNQSMQYDREVFMDDELA